MGYQSTNGHQRAYYYFGHYALPDGAVITNASLQLHQEAGVSNGQQVHTTAITSSWSHSTISWNTAPSICVSCMPAVDALTTNGMITQDLTPIFQARYTRSTIDWRVDYGFTTRLVNDTGTTGSADEVVFFSASEGQVDLRPQLILT